MTTKITEQNISNIANAGVQWQSVFVGDGSTGLTAVAGRGYFINTTSGTVTVTLPASPSVGDVVVLKDYATTWGTNAVSITSTTFDGASNDPSFSTNGQTITLVYMDGTKGWSLINEDTTTNLGAEFIAATGGTVATSGDYKIHTFTGDGCFVVSGVGNPAGSDSVDYLVVAGGGSGAPDDGGGGGAGGLRYSASTYCAPGPGSPFAGSLLPVSATTYPITVGGGGAGVSASPSFPNGNNGSNSVFSTLTSTGGGYGASNRPATAGSSGGSGGGGGAPAGSGGAGNTPSVSPPQGSPGGTGGVGGAGGGGFLGNGSPGAATLDNAGGPGIDLSITGSPVTYAAGGTGDANAANTPNAAANTGNGSAGSNMGAPSSSGNGGKGIVVIRYKFQ